jgi:hypothetical protein
MTSRVVVAAAVLVVAAASAAPLPSARAAGAEAVEPAKEPGDALMKSLLDALKSGSYALYGSVAASESKLSQPSFERLSREWAPQLLKGYKTTYLGKVRKVDHDLDLWKLEPAGAPEEVVLTVSLKGGRISAFSFR